MTGSSYSSMSNILLTVTPFKPSYRSLEMNSRLNISFETATLEHELISQISFLFPYILILRKIYFMSQGFEVG